VAGYSQRFAQMALGHNSKAIHRAYARKAQVVLPSLEEYEQKIVPTTNLPQREPVTAKPPATTSLYPLCYRCGILFQPQRERFNVMESDP